MAASSADWRSLLLRPFEPLARSTRGYNLSRLRGDLVAGLTVAVVEIPQAMAYAYIAGVPPQYGIYTSIVQGFVGAIFTSNDHLATGPTNTHALLIAATLTRVAAPGDVSTYLQLCFFLCVLKGLIQLAFALARLGHLIRYVSSGVIVGFTAGAGALIAIGQVPAFLGVHVSHDESHWPGVIGAVQELVPKLHHVEPAAVIIGSISLAILIVSRWINRLLPGPLLAIAFCGLIVWGLGWTSDLLPLVGAIPGENLFVPVMPTATLEQVELLIPGAFALAVLGLIETVAIGKSLMSREGRRVQANQEFFAQGVANIVGGFFQNMPGTGSFTRSALNRDAGGETRFAAMFNSAFILLIFLLCREQARYIPLSALAAILFVIAYGLVDWRFMRRVMRADRSESLICFTTFAATLLLPLHYAIYVGIFLNLALYLRKASQLHMAEMVLTKQGAYVERPLRTREGHGDVIFIQVEGDLFFAVAEELQDRLNDLSNQGYKVVIFRLKRTHSIDATVLAVLEEWIRQRQARGRHVILCGVREELLERLKRYGLVDLIGRENVFAAGYGVFTSAKAAIQRAKAILGSSIDEEDLLVDDHEEDGPRTWSYSI